MTNLQTTVTSRTHDFQFVKDFFFWLSNSVVRLGIRTNPGLIAYSGGIDSTSLVLGLKELAVPFELGTVDHGVRQRSPQEILTLRKIALHVGVPLHERQVSGLSPTESFEERARVARYDALEELRRERGLAWIATAHTANDQAETVLMRLARGASLRGAEGILEQRKDFVVRPLLGVTRAHTSAVVRAREVECIEDPMNQDPLYCRVRVRREVLPALEDAVNPGAALALSRFAALAHEDEHYFASLVQKEYERLHQGSGLSRPTFLQLPRPIARRVLATFLEENDLPLSFGLVERCLEAIRELNDTALPRDQLLRVTAGNIAIQAAPPRRDSRR